MIDKSTAVLLEKIDAFLTETGMGASYFGKVATGNSELVSRLRNGGRIWPDTEQRVHAFMAAHRNGRKAARREDAA